MSDAALELKGLVKRYGRITALDELELSIPQGVVCGFIGPNGAGKTTTFGISAGLIRADAGEVNILGRGPLDPIKHAGTVNMLPQDCQLSPHVSLRALLTHYGRLQGMTAGDAAKSVDSILDHVALTDRANARIKQLSHGMRRRVAIAQALLGDPKLVLLDEPTSGLDPELVVRMRDLFAEHRGQRTLIVSSHNLLELEALCDFVVFIDRGRCTRIGTLAEVTEQGEGLMMRYFVERAVPLEQLEATQPALEMTWQGQTLVARATSGTWTAAAINGAIVPYLFHMTAGLLEIRKGQSLEDAYLADKADEAEDG